MTLRRYVPVLLVASLPACNPGVPGGPLRVGAGQLRQTCTSQGCAGAEGSAGAGGSSTATVTQEQTQAARSPAQMVAEFEKSGARLRELGVPPVMPRSYVTFGTLDLARPMPSEPRDVWGSWGGYGIQYDTVSGQGSTVFDADAHRWILQQNLHRGSVTTDGAEVVYMVKIYCSPIRSQTVTFRKYHWDAAMQQETPLDDDRDPATVARIERLQWTATEVPDPKCAYEEAFAPDGGDVNDAYTYVVTRKYAILRIPVRRGNLIRWTAAHDPLYWDSAVGRYVGSCPAGSQTCEPVYDRQAVGGEFGVVRPVQLGTITVPVLPTMVLYEPPQPQWSESYQGDRTASPGTAVASYEEAVTVGTAVSASFRTEESAQNFDVPTYGSTRAKEGVEKAAKVAGKLPVIGTAAGLVLEGLGFALGLFGDQNISKFDGSASDRTRRVVVKSQQHLTFGTTARLGPGRGDIIGWYEDVTLGYVFVDGEVSLVPLDTGTEHAYTVNELRGYRAWKACRDPRYVNQPILMPQHCFSGTYPDGELIDQPDPLMVDRLRNTSDQDLGALLALDPFFADPALELTGDPNGRFFDCEQLSAAGTATARYMDELQEEGSDSLLTFRSHTLRATPGLFSDFPDVNQSFKLQHQSIRQGSVTTSYGSALQITREAGTDTYAGIRCRDRAFTTQAFQLHRPQR